ncbi:MAG: hypothetical protein KDJ44_01845 [Rhodoblastus sp.]|jgi:hypothetical protein|nr:hypothetical protein [Rhodoblastus sp.]MCC2106206.1 hypothetical protein [Hyphomicrobiales bacterium]
MSQIAFHSHVIGRNDNPWLTTGRDIDIAGRDADTLRAHAADAILAAFPCPTLLSRGAIATRRWIDFSVEGHAFQARFRPRDYSVEVRLK